MKFRIILFSCLIFALPIALRAASVTPALIDLSGDRGQKIESTFEVINIKDKPETYYLDTLTFQAKGETGEPEFSAKDAFAKWIQFPTERVNVPANSKVSVPFSVLIPSDVASGSYHSAITVSSAPSEVIATNGAIVEAKTAILVFLSVNGESIKKVVLLDFAGNTNGIQTDLAQNYTFRIQNQGNVTSVPVGTIEVKDFFGRILSTQEVNEAKNRILPKSTRVFETNNQKVTGFLNLLKDQSRVFALGTLTSTLHIDPGEGFAPIQTSTTFFYIPYQLISTVFALILLIFLGYKIISKRN